MKSNIKKNQAAPTLNIPADVSQYCRQAAAVLKSSQKLLDREIRQAEDWAKTDGVTEWDVKFRPADITRTRENLVKAAELLDWLADHGGANP